MKPSIIKPGLLVSLKTSIVGGVNYQRVDIENEHVDEHGESVAKWETRRAIQDPQEYERAIVARGKARSLITSVCARSSFGLLCPSANEPELADAIEAAREVTEAHNSDASVSRVEVYVLVGRVAQDDTEAARAIGAEVRELLDNMRDGVLSGNVEAIREAANKARGLGDMLSADVSGQVSAAIKEARSIAREIVRRVEKSGEVAADVVKEVNMKAIDDARFAFLETEDHDVIVEPIAPAARGIEFDAAGA